MHQLVPPQSGLFPWHPPSHCRRSVASAFRCISSSWPNAQPCAWLPGRNRCMRSLLHATTESLRRLARRVWEHRSVVVKSCTGMALSRERSFLCVGRQCGPSLVNEITQVATPF